MSQKTIGILGGAGVWASAGLLARINGLVCANGASFDQDHPELVLVHATQAPSRSLWLEGRGPSFLAAYVRAAIQLKLAGADFVAMSCNTAHVLRREIEEGAEIEVIDLVELAAKQAIDQSGVHKCIGVMESDGSQKFGLYRKAIEALDLEVKIIELDAHHQRLLTRAIVSLKRGEHLIAIPPDSPSELMGRAANFLRDQGADTIVLGCTELPLAFPQTWHDCAIVDTIDVLARACLGQSGLPGPWS
jgi:aspartate racemase